MAKKCDVKKLIKKMDELASKIIRSQGYCEVCGKTSNLQCAHVISRKFIQTRFDLENLLCLCWHCHFEFAHKDPIGFARWFDNKFGGNLYDELKRRSKKIKKFDYEGKYQELLNLWEQTK